MAKGDSSRSQNQINNQGTTAQDSQNATMNQLYGQNLGFQNNYNTGVATDLNSYNQINNNYQGLIDSINNGTNSSLNLPGPISASNISNVGAATSPYFQNFADTGGFSSSDLADMRARAISPTRATFANAQSNLNQNKAAQQFSPNYAAATAKLTRDLGYGISDANVDANASIAQLVQSGKLAGAQGLAGLDEFNIGQGNSVNEFNAGQNNQVGEFNAGLAQSNAGLTGQALLGAMNGQTSLYGATPGLANTFGNQLISSSGQLLTGNQNQTNLSLGLINGQNQKGATVPGDTSQVINNAANGLKTVGGAFGGPSF